MITPPSAESPSQNQPAAAVEPGMEVALQNFWEKNRNGILLVCVVVLLVLLGREVMQYFAASHEREVRQAYAKVADRPEQLATFASANAGHVLAGVAYLRLADTKYAAGDFRAAAENYTKALADLKQPILLGRAKIGAAMSQINGTDKADGETALKAVSADVNLPKAARAEATYHLATLAQDAGNAAEVSRLVAEVGKIDPTSTWSQRATALLTAR